MTIDQPRSLAVRQARYRQIAEQLRRQILSGTFQAGDKLPTEQELARVHGVSRVTSAAALAFLAREGLVVRSPRRGTIVRAAAADADAAARPLFAWIQQSMDDGVGLDLLRGIERAADEAGFNLMLRITGTVRAKEEQAIRDAVAAGAVALALWPQDGETYNAEVLRLVLNGFPVVLVDRHLRGVQCASAESDNVAGARDLVRLLVEQGHRAIAAMVFPVKGTSTIEYRLDGYTQALTAAGIPVDHSLIFVEGQFPTEPHECVSEDIVERFVAFLRAHPQVTAIFASNGRLAQIALPALERLRVRVPDDMSLVSIDSLPGVPGIRSPITCALQHSWEIGATAIQLVQEGLAGAAPRRVLLPMRIHHANSIAPPKVRIS